MRDERRRITGQVTVAALLERWPGLASAFRRRGMSCPGCVMSKFDTLDYVAEIYGLGTQEWLGELNRKAGRTPERSRRDATTRTDARGARPGGEP